MDFKLHPLVLLNISDHHTRLKAQQQGGQEAPRVLGCLLGLHLSRTVEICNSFEIKYDGFADGVPQIDSAFLTQKQEQYKKVFPKLDVIGWYSTGAQLQDADLTLQHGMLAITESPVYLLFNTSVQGGKDLPVTLYESEVHVVNDAPQLTFVQAEYTVEIGEAERIAVDHVTRALPMDANSSAAQLTSHLTGINSAAVMLASRVRVLRDYVTAVAEGKAPHNHAVMRQIAALLRQLPAAADSASFQREHMTELNDMLLMLGVTAMTKGTAQVHDVADRLNVVHSDNTTGHTARRMMRSSFF